MQTLHNFLIQEATQIGEARRAALSLASNLGFSEQDAGRVAIIVNEAASNLLKHAGASGGEMLIQHTQLEAQSAIEIIALDRGPGIANLSDALKDGYSTSGTQGIGLGGIRRLSDEFDLFSTPNHGTVIYSKIWSSKTNQELAALPPYSIGGISIPFQGETVSGDAWDFEALSDSILTIMVADGLGHGIAAHEAAVQAIRSFHHEKHSALPEMMKTTDSVLKKTRGAAVSVVRLDLQSRLARYVGVGNISCSIMTEDKSQSLVSMNGTVGHECRRIQEFSYPFDPSGLLIMHSDGLQTRWNLSTYPGLSRKHPTLIAAVLYRDYSRKRDDVTVVVLRQNRFFQSKSA